MNKEKIICIYCIFNNLNNNFYIGSTSNYERRVYTHLYALNNNKHVNKYLQNAWNKYGEDSFEIFILKDSTLDTLLPDEQWCIDIFKPEYNFCKIAGSSLGTTWSKEQRNKIELIWTKERRKKFSNILKNSEIFVTKSKERCKILGEKSRKPIYVKDLSGHIIYEFKSVVLGSKDLDISKHPIYNRVTGKIKTPYKNKYYFEYKN